MKPHLLPDPKEDTLFPIFLKLEELPLLIVGGGRVGHETLVAVLHKSPGARVALVAPEISAEIRNLCKNFPQTDLREKPFEEADLDGRRLVIAATADRILNERIKQLANVQGLLANVAGTPDLCDFYLDSIVQKDKLKKVRILNRITGVPAARRGRVESLDGRNWKRLATIAISAFGILLLANILYLSGFYTELSPEFWTFMAIGFLAQMVDGLLGMGYGVTAAIGLMTFNVPAAALSSSIHTAEMFASGASGYSHYRFGNVNRRLFRALLVPGIIGAVCGALLLVWLDGHGSQLVKPLLAAYTLTLGIRILWRAFTPKTAESKVKRVGLLAGAGGFLDSFGGGGWGPLVTGTLITKGKTPRYVIGSVSLSEFFITLASALTFFAVIGIRHWPVVLGLIAGGVLAAPLAARLVGKLPVRTMCIGVGIMVILWSGIILWKVIEQY